MITRFKIIGCLAASALVFLLATPHALGAQDETAKPGSLVVVNLELKDVPVKDAIAKLFEGAGLKYSMKPEVPGRVVELTLKEFGKLRRQLVAPDELHVSPTRCKTRRTF